MINKETCGLTAIEAENCSWTFSGQNGRQETPEMACRFSIPTFMASRHDYELDPSGYWHVHLDHKHIGSGGDDSWSPSVLQVASLDPLNPVNPKP